jgi:mono/diheme cytochrome c family protein
MITARAMQLSIVLLAILTGLSLALSSSLAWAGDAGSQTPGTIISGDSRRGEKLYDASCVVCHGPRATGGIGPRLAGNPVLSKEKTFWTVVYEGQHVMPPLQGAVTEQQMADIRAWLLTLR